MKIDKKIIEELINKQDRILKIVEKTIERVEKLERLDLKKALVKSEEINLPEQEKNRIVAKRVEDILLTVKTLDVLNSVQRDAIIDYLAKKSGVGKTAIKDFLWAGKTYLDRLVEVRIIKK